MATLKEKLQEKGAKCNLQFTTREREYFEQECGFTDIELKVFRLRSRGFSVVQIQMILQEETDQYWSISRVEARIRAVKDKILAIL